MTAITGANYGIKRAWGAGFNGWDTDMDGNLLLLDTMIDLSVIDHTLTAPPGSPTEGATYIVAPSPTGAWSAQPGKIAVYIGGMWIFYSARVGKWAFSANGSKTLKFDGTIWPEFIASGGGGSTTYAALTDVDITGLVDTSFARFDVTSGRWKMITIVNGTNVTFSMSGSVLTINSTAGGGGGSTALSGLSDVAVVEGAGIDGNALVWKQSGLKWTTQALAPVATSNNYGDLTGTPTLASVATSGVYGDLTSRPTIPAVVAFTPTGTGVPLMDTSVSNTVKIASLVQGSGIVLTADGAGGVNVSATGIGQGSNYNAPYKGTVLAKTSTIAVPGVTLTYIPWDVATRDTNGMYSSSNPTRLTVPAGITRIRLAAGFGVASGNSSSTGYLVIRKNGTTILRRNMTQFGSFANPAMTVITEVLDVAAADYFEAGIETSIALTGAIADCYFACDIVELTTASAPPVNNAFEIAGGPTANQVLRTWLNPVAVVYPADFNGSLAACDPTTPATATTVLKIMKLPAGSSSWAQVGTITYTAGSTSAGFSSIGVSVTFEIGSQTRIQGPATADASLANLLMALLGTRG